MKYIYSLITFFVIIALAVSCEKQENQVFYKGGTNPVLSASSTSNLTLLPSIAANNAVNFDWTNPSYTFSTGLSTLDVSNALEIARAGTNFASPTTVSMGTSLQKRFTVKELNSILMGMNLDGGTLYNMEFRIKSSIDAAVPLYSNVVKLNITPYLDTKYPVPDKLFIVGSATPNGWGNPTTAAQQFTKTNASTFKITIALAANEWYLFLPVNGSWNNKYAFDGTKGANNPLGDNFAMDKGEDIASPTVAGTYVITVDFKTGRYSLVKQ